MLRVFFKELKRIVLAEFFDDIPISQWFSDLIGLPAQTEEYAASIDQEVGEKGLGSNEDSSKMIGPTFIAIAIIFFLLILISGVIIFIARRI